MLKFIKLTILQPSSNWRQLAEFEVWGRDSCDGLEVKQEEMSHNLINEKEKFGFSSDQRDLTDATSFSNFPNPFNKRTQISFQMSASSHVRIAIYNIIGKEITMLVDEWKTAGSHQVFWNGRNESGIAAPSGIYIVQMRVGTFCQSRKLILMK